MTFIVAQIVVWPIPISIFSINNSLCSPGLRFIGRMAQHFSGRGGVRLCSQEEGEARKQLWQKLSILLKKGNAALLTNRIPALRYCNRY